jgi:hypothetical protein
MFYNKYETEISRSELEKIFGLLKDPLCLVGGWAVFQTVNASFQSQNGREYIQSRDIDLGFHVGKDWTDADLAACPVVNTIKRLEQIGFTPVGSRMQKYFDTETRKHLSREESKTRPQPFLFDLYVDPIVDCIHPQLIDILGFTPLDEPLLSQAMVDKRSKQVQLYGGRCLLPDPEILVSMKLHSVLSRNKDEKRKKDVADIYALLWHSGISLDSMKEKLNGLPLRKSIPEVIANLLPKDYADAARILDIEASQVERVIKELGT